MLQLLFSGASVRTNKFKSICFIHRLGNIESLNVTASASYNSLKLLFCFDSFGNYLYSEGFCQIGYSF